MTHPYYVVAPRYARNSAGVRVLHQLCHKLREIGYEAFIISAETNDRLNTPLLSQGAVDTHFAAGLCPIVIYPEVVLGNPLAAPFVARYVLNYPGALGGPEAFDPNEYLFYYSKELRPKTETSRRVLHIPAVDTSIFHPPKEAGVRSGSCFYAGKFKTVHHGKLLSITDGSFEITREQPATQEQIADLFRKSEVFYCYENSALSLEATLCGCPAVLLPNKYFTSIIASQELGTDGLAWGTSDQEIARAKATVGRVWENYAKTQIELVSSLKDFAEETQLIASTKAYASRIRLFDPFAACSIPKWRRALRFAMLSISTPVSAAELISYAQEVQLKGFKGLKQKLKERELRLLSNRVCKRSDTP